jgi:isoleucyl-tRNA synthetase
VPGFEGARVIDEKGKKGDANKRIIEALIKADKLFARARYKHTYPHSWRSKKPVIFRNTPQWFVYMDKPLRHSSEGWNPEGQTLRQLSLKAISETAFYPPQGQKRLEAMIAGRPDWVLSRQRAWGVPICVFVHKDTGQVIPGEGYDHNETLSQRILDSFAKEGADVWFEEGAKERYLEGLVDDPEQWDQVKDILDVWFDSGCTHAFVLEDRDDLSSPADLYLEGSDQHRGWFHSSLLESCGTRGRAPYKGVLTHGFVLDEQGRKMSKSLGNVTTPEEVIKESGADILRLWVAASDYADDLRIGKEILKTMVDTYRKLRNTLRWMLGSLGHDQGERIAFEEMPELERLMLHRLYEVSRQVKEGYESYDFKKVTSVLINFMTLDLSAFYFDIRKDTLYCDAPSSLRRKACLTVLNTTLEACLTWLAPILPFTCEEAWGYAGKQGSIHNQSFTELSESWQDADLAAKWGHIRKVRRVVTGALEIERREKKSVHHWKQRPSFISLMKRYVISCGVDMDDICITSAITLEEGQGPDEAYRLDDVSRCCCCFSNGTGKEMRPFMENIGRCGQRCSVS